MPIDLTELSPNESSNLDELNLANGLYTASYLCNIGVKSLLTECGYQPKREIQIKSALDNLQSEDSFDTLKSGESTEWSPYRGKFIALPSEWSDLESRLYVINPTKSHYGGYHFAMLDYGQETDNALIEDEETIFELLLFRNTGNYVCPETVFLEAMKTRCGNIPWNRTKLLTGQYESPTMWGNSKATIAYKYPIKHPGVNYFKKYEISIRNYGRISLGGQDYHLFMRLVSDLGPAMPTDQLHQPSSIERFFENIGKPFFGDQLPQGVY